MAVREFIVAYLPCWSGAAGQHARRDPRVNTRRLLQDRLEDAIVVERDDARTLVVDDPSELTHRSAADGVVLELRQIVSEEGLEQEFDSRELDGPLSVPVADCVRSIRL